MGSRKTAFLLAVAILAPAAGLAQITKDEVDERMDEAIGLLRMTVAAETKLMHSFEIDQSDPTTLAAKRELCSKWPKAQRTIEEVSELEAQLRKDKSLASDPDLSNKMAELLPIKRDAVSKRRQLNAMGLFCEDGSGAAGPTAGLPPVPSGDSAPAGQRAVSVSPEFLVAAKRALTAFTDLGTDYAFVVSSDFRWVTSERSLEEHERTAKAAYDECVARVPAKSADTYPADEYVRELFLNWNMEFSKIELNRSEKRLKAMGVDNGVPLDKVSPGRMAARRAEIPEALELNLTPSQWKDKRQTSECLMAGSEKGSAAP